jgi:hypothetical protein
MPAFTSITVYQWDAQVLTRYLKNVHVHFNGLFTPKAVSKALLMSVLAIVALGPKFKIISMASSID